MTLVENVDVLVVGSGISGLTAALRAQELGLRVLLVEKTDHIGGSSALSGGLLWIPNNPLLHEDGIDDSAEKALQYLDAVVGEQAGPAASPARREAFVKSGPLTVEFLRRSGLRLERCAGYSDYYPEHPGGLPEGRAVRGAAYDLRELGSWEAVLRPRTFLPGVVIHMEEASPCLTAVTTGRGKRVASRVAGRTARGFLRRQHLASLGASLMGQLLAIAVSRGLDVRPGLGLDELIVDRDAVTGAVLRARDGSTSTVSCEATILACGGFAHNEAMRKEHGPMPASSEWTLASPGDTGDGICSAQAIGGAVSLMDEAIWMGVGVRPDGRRELYLFERSLPHSLIVDSAGFRFVNESTDYVRFGQAIYRRQKEVEAVPCWLILDRQHRRRYGLGEAPPGFLPPSFVRSGYVKKADSIEELAHSCGIDPATLTESVTRFNALAAAGRDDDFSRGESHYDRYFGDPANRPNPNLGGLTDPPYYAVRIWPGDVGTAGGLLCDEHARVLRDDGSAIGGLYAIGNTAATPMGRTYPGPGASIGVGATFGYIAANHAASAHKP